MSKKEKTPKHYWDACTFINVISGNEPDGSNILRSRVKAVDRGEMYLITSAFTLAEVVKPQGVTSLSQNDESKIRNAFKNSNMYVYELSSIIAERAREIQWNCDKKIKPPDAIHLATAEFAEVDRFDTYDDKLIEKAHAIPEGFWNHKFDIGHPSLIQHELDV